MIKLTSLLKQILNEGGNVFGTTASIKKENIESTMEKFVEVLGEIFPKKASTFKSFEKLGSAGKKDISGDIDLSYDVKNFLTGEKPDFEGWDINPTEFNELSEKIAKRARTATPAQIALRAMLELIANKVNQSNLTIESDPKSATNGSLFFAFPQYNEAGEELPESVQIDINVGNPEWLRFSYYSNLYKGNVKGLHRTQLLVALFANKGKIFKHGQGIIDKETREVEAESPKETLELINKLYGVEITQDVLNDYFELIDYLKSHLSQEDLNSIFDTYLKILDSTRADIPEDLQDYWIKNQERLGLKGKFLPDDSNLIKYKTA